MQESSGMAEQYECGVTIYQCRVVQLEGRAH